jgi:hypothetical protein
MPALRPKGGKIPAVFEEPQVASGKAVVVSQPVSLIDSIVLEPLKVCR